MSKPTSFGIGIVALGIAAAAFFGPSAAKQASVTVLAAAPTASQPAGEPTSKPKAGKSAASQPASKPTASQPAARSAGKFANARCPIMGSRIDPAKVPNSLTREYKGQKIAFCCGGCPGAWDRLSDEKKQAKLKAAMD